MPASILPHKRKLAQSRVAIVHPYLVSRGGGEKVIDALAELLPHAHIFTMMADQATFSPAVARLPVHVSWLDKAPGRARFYQHLSPFFDAAVNSYDLSEYDLVITSGGPGAKTAPIAAHSVHVHYCHSPVRFLWDQYDTWLDRLPWPLRALFALSVRQQRKRDLKGVQSVDVMVANSDFIGERIARYYAMDSRTIYPPVDLADTPPAQEPSDYYLTVGRLVPNKRTELLVEACTKLGRQLVVVGAGPEHQRLAAMAGPTIELAGRVSSQQLARLFVNARAYLFAAEEDFGIATVEAQSYGLPVIAYGVGGTAEIVSPPDNGLLFDEQSVEAVMQALETFEKHETGFDRAAIQKHAQRFSKARFMQEMEQLLVESLESS